MPNAGRIRVNLLRLVSFTALLAALAAEPLATAQARPAAPASPAPAEVANDRDVQATQAELIRLLRLSPTLTTVVEHDPSLLSNQDYVSHNNPQLAQFLAAHPEIARNPEFYLFTHLEGDGGRDQALERAVWPEQHPWRESTPMDRMLDAFVPFMVFACILLALLWLTRQLLENRRWNRVFKMQTEVHGRLIEKLGSSQELMTYMGTEAGKKFLEAAPISVGFEPQQRVPNAVARVLTPLQVGIVLTLLGSGLLGLRNSLGADAVAPTLLIGTVVLMPGIGFIISAGVSWFLAGRLGLMPERSAPGQLLPPFDSQERR